MAVQPGIKDTGRAPETVAPIRRGAQIFRVFYQCAVWACADPRVRGMQWPQSAPVESVEAIERGEVAADPPSPSRPGSSRTARWNRVEELKQCAGSPFRPIRFSHRYSVHVARDKPVCGPGQVVVEELCAIDAVACMGNERP